MKHRKLLTASIALVSGGLALTGCSGWSYAPPMRGNANLEPMNLGKGQAAAPGAPANFTQALAVEYSSLAGSMSTTPMTTQTGDWADADYFSRKSLKAGNGDVVLPENNGNWLVPLEVGHGFRTQLADGRKRLMVVLDAGARDRSPALAARAQVRYDCWVEQMERDWQLGSTGTCHSDFLAALDELEGSHKPVAAVPPPTQARGFNVFFDFDKSALTIEGRRIVDAAATAAHGGATIQITLVGKADLSGTDPYNMNLSHRRADIVRGAFLADGITSDQIAEHWVGEREPPVPTEQGVREPRNRVVEVGLH
jgi:OOP family OmpA-OmpF porin